MWVSVGAPYLAAGGVAGPGRVRWEAEVLAAPAVGNAFAGAAGTAWPREGNGAVGDDEVSWGVFARDGEARHM